MAERSKALDSSSSLRLKAWVRIPLEPLFTQSNGGLAQSVECVVCNDEAPGSKPGFSTFLFAREQWQVGRVVKAVDSKSTGLRPRQFESGTCRLSVCRFSIVVIAPAL